MYKAVMQQLYEDGIGAIRWQGWTTTIAELKLAGWVISHKEPYRNWRDAKNSAKANRYIYLRNHALRMIGRLRVEKNQHYNLTSDEMVGNDVIRNYTLDFLTGESNRKLRPKPVYDDAVTEAVLSTAEDIPALLDLVLQLQGPQKKKRKQAEITYLDDLKKLMSNQA